jgi:hypothetical protein
MKLIVGGGSSSHVGKTTLACQLLAALAPTGTWVAMKVSVTERARPLRVLVEQDVTLTERHRDSARLLAAGARAVIWVTVSRPEVRRGLAAGLRVARACRPTGVVLESTSAGIELHRPTVSWFVAGALPWKPWAWRHLVRADHVVTADGAGGWIDGQWPLHRQVPQHPSTLASERRSVMVAPRRASAASMVVRDEERAPPRGTRSHVPA